METNEVIENEVVEVANDTTEDNQIDYKAKFEEADKESRRLNGIIQKHKKAPKADVNAESPTMGEADVQKMLDEREFYKTNSSLVEHKEAISKLTSMGNSLEDAKLLVMNKNPDIANRQATNNSNFTAGTPDFAQSEYSISDLEGMTQGQYNQVIKLQQEGKVVIK